MARNRRNEFYAVMGDTGKSARLTEHEDGWRVAILDRDSGDVLETFDDVFASQGAALMAALKDAGAYRKDGER